MHLAHSRAGVQGYRKVNCKLFNFTNLIFASHFVQILDLVLKLSKSLATTPCGSYS